MAAAYLFHIVKNHAFEDGNKRTGMHAAIAFLGMNDIDIDIGTDEGEQLTIGIATSAIEKPAAIKFFQNKIGNIGFATGT